MRWTGYKLNRPTKAVLGSGLGGEYFSQPFTTLCDSNKYLP